MNDPQLPQRTETEIERRVFLALAQKVFPGVEIFLARSDTVLFHRVYGRFNQTPDSPPLTLNAVFDLASLTKPLATASAILHLIEHGALALTTPIGRLLADFNQSPHSTITIQQLLTHTSGMPAWAPLYSPDFNRQRGWQKLRSMPLLYPPGTAVTYSCLGFILLAEILRRVTQISLNQYCRQYLFTPLGLSSLSFHPDPTRPDIVPTAFCPHRGGLLRGVVHDENAYLFEGEGGNAGLFGSALDIHRFCRLLWQRGQLDGIRIFTEETVASFLRNHNPPYLPPRALGWDYHSGRDEYHSCGRYMPVGSLGHLGFTGTSLWMDPVSQTLVLILSNRVNISRDENLPLLRSFRPEIHDLLLSALF